MATELAFEQIHPFVRFVRYLELDGQNGFPPFCPYDCRLLYTCAGRGEIDVRGDRFDMAPGSLLLWQSGIPYHLLTPKKGHVTYLAINFDFTYAHFEKSYPIPPVSKEAFQESGVLEQIFFTDLPLFNRPVYLPDIREIEDSLLELLRESGAKRRFYRNKASATLQTVLLSAAKRAVLCQQEKEDVPGRADEILDYISRHYTESLSNREIGERFCYHPNYVSHLMVLHTGQSLHQYILSLRISKALRLIEATDMPISEIAYCVGFKDVCHFSRYFKKTTGRNPRDFRKTAF